MLCIGFRIECCVLGVVYWVLGVGYWVQWCWVLRVVSYVLRVSCWVLCVVVWVLGDACGVLCVAWCL